MKAPTHQCCALVDLKKNKQFKTLAEVKIFSRQVQQQQDKMRREYEEEQERKRSKEQAVRADLQYRYAGLKSEPRVS